MSAVSPVAIVTGAGSGIGAAIAGVLADEGYAVALVGRRASPLEEVATHLRDTAGAAALVVACDLGLPEAAARIVGSVLERWGRVDLLVNNAGQAPRSPLAASEPNELDHLFRVNLLAPFQLVAELWPVFLQQQRGAVINISSVLAASPSPGFAAYAATKQGLESLTRSILSEAGALPIRAYCVAPGAVDTPLLQALVAAGLDAPRALLSPAAVARVVLACVRGHSPLDGRPIAVAAEDGR